MEGQAAPENAIIEIVTRELWKAKPPVREVAMKDKARHVMFLNFGHKKCSDRRDCASAMRWMQHFNMTFQNQIDIRYNFVVGGDGSIFEGRGWHAIPLLPKRFVRVDPQCILVGFIGPFYEESSLPDVMRRTGAKLIEYGVDNDLIAKDFLYHDLSKNL